MNSQLLALAWKALLMASAFSPLTPHSPPPASRLTPFLLFKCTKPFDLRASFFWPEVPFPSSSKAESPLQVSAPSLLLPAPTADLPNYSPSHPPVDLRHSLALFKIGT